jgi:hypothetical protein
MDDSTLGAEIHEKKEHAPPYVAYRTFKNFTDSLRVAMPSRIDRSVMHTMSGAAQSHVMAALKSMDLVSRQGIPTERFKNLVQMEGDQQKSILKESIRVGFPFLFDGSIDLSTATGKQLLEKFEHTPLSGNTLRRSVAFFLAAGKDAGMGLSPYFEKIHSRTGAAPTKRSSPPANGKVIPYIDGVAETDDEESSEEEKRPPLAIESLTVKLKSGGSITLTASTSFIKMSADDRNFVFDIIDRLQKYESAT